MHTGYALGVGNFYYEPDGLIYGSLPALNIDSNTLSDGFTWSDFVAAKAYTDNLVIAVNRGGTMSNVSYESHCVYREQPDPTAAPS